uniref:Uncharacterized protein n=1 Tax=Globisporangium ultimum (strain ATCC 200006 / CBS 805.95 / DAOM BR144) TaxID=431595 RepID=K3WYV0_GLOUD
MDSKSTTKYAIQVPPKCDPKDNSFEGSATSRPFTNALINLGVLFLVVYRNLQEGKIWIGDAFVSISNSLLYHFSTLLEFLLDNVTILSEK